MIVIKDLSFSYDGNKPLFENLNIKIPKGKFITIIGPNGCGKSTLLRLISKELKYNSGDIIISEKKLLDIKTLELAQKLAFSRQKTSENLSFTCLDYVLLGRRPYKEQFEDFNKNDLKIVEKNLKITDSISFINKNLNQISGGEFQRISFAKILTQNTPLILLDESFSAMDINYKVLSLKILKEKVREGKTILCVMHDINLAYKYSDHIIMLKEGKVYNYGKPDSILNTSSIKEVFEIEVEKIEKKGFL